MTERRAGRIVAQLLDFEAQRVLGMASLGRDGRVRPEDVAAIDEAMEVLLGHLAELGLAYPGQTLGARYELGGMEYCILQLALLPYHAPEILALVISVLGDDVSEPRLSHALQLLQPMGDDWAELQRSMMGRPLFQESLVRLDPEDDGDPSLHPHAAVLELFGLGEEV